MEVHKENNTWALFPLLLFVMLSLGVGTTTGDFTSMLLNVTITITITVALLVNRKESSAKKVEVFTKGAGHSNTVLMVLIFILADAFSSTTERMGGVKSAVNLRLSSIPENLIVVGLSVICMFVPVSMGTSVGTVAVIVPVDYGLAQATGILTTLAMATVVGGTMFDDNLSMISSTTIVAVRTQHTEMKDEFKANSETVLLGAILTIIILYFLTDGISPSHARDYDYNLIEVIPYILVLVLTLLGVNVIIVSIGGTLLAGIIGLIGGPFSQVELLDAVSRGIISMEDVATIALLIGGLAGIIQHSGGIEWLLQFVRSRMKSKHGTKLGIANLVSVAGITTANNTISTIMSGPLAKNIVDEYDVDSRRSASILDIFGGYLQDSLPHNPQVIPAIDVADISPLVLFPYSIYPILLGACGLAAILFNFLELRKNTSQEMKH